MEEPKSVTVHIRATLSEETRKQLNTAYRGTIRKLRHMLNEHGKGGEDGDE